jgi:ribosomal peptide maturation radical SAM protein 1
MSKTDIVLVSMPFAPFFTPNAGIGVLTAAARKAGLAVSATYPAIRLGQQIGTVLYNFIAETYSARVTLLGDWLFAGCLSDEPTQVPEEYEQIYQQSYRNFLEGFLNERATALITPLKELREQCREFLECEAQQLVALNPRIVGCSSTFFQHAASLALLKRIKALKPDILTMIGGANCEADMGYETARQFPWVDFVFSGEADDTFPTLCQIVFATGKPVSVADLPYGVYTSEKIRLQEQFAPRPTEYEVALVNDLDTVCMPNYDEYFTELDQTGMVSQDYRVCAVESARGCQKGEQSLCNFCGLNGARVCYRSKSKDKFLAELDALSQRYASRVFLLTDNILARQAFAEWLHDAAAEKKWTFFLEIRSTLTEHQVKALAEAEVFNVQPGIESLNDHLLRLMNKGNSTLVNIASMKFVKEQAISLAWNLLYNIPGEEEEDYRRIAELIPLLHHLQPPQASQISFCKFSPYYQTPEKYGLTLVPSPAYHVVYPRMSAAALQRLAYHFVDQSHREQACQPLSEAKQLMLNRVQEWKRLHNFCQGTDPNTIAMTLPSLTMNDVNNLIKIRDNRRCAVSSHFFLDAVESEIYRYTRSPRTLEQIHACVSQSPQLKPFLNEVEPDIEGLIDKKLLITIGNQYLSLATYPRKKLSALQTQGLKHLQQRAQLLYPAQQTTE